MAMVGHTGLASDRFAAARTCTRARQVGWAADVVPDGRDDMTELSVKPLDEITSPDFALLVERHGGV